MVAMLASAPAFAETSASSAAAAAAGIVPERPRPTVAAPSSAAPAAPRFTTPVASSIASRVGLAETGGAPSARKPCKPKPGAKTC
jgi:hypothetical protein